MSPTRDTESSGEMKKIAIAESGHYASDLIETRSEHLA